MLAQWPLAETRDHSNFKASFHSAVERSVGSVWTERLIEISNPGQAGLHAGLGVRKRVPFIQGGYLQPGKKILSLTVQKVTGKNTFCFPCVLK